MTGDRSKRQQSVAENPLLASALVYASMGYYVFPCFSVVNGRCTCGRAGCNTPGKHPIIRGGHTSASSDPVQITKWWGKNPTANVAIATGKASGLVVVDKDVGPGKFGDETLDALQERLGKLPETPEQITGSGGAQLFFKYPDTVTIRSRRGFAPGIDIRADGGYVIVPPSSHISGRQYSWEASSRIGALPLAQLPLRWLEALCDRAAGSEQPIGEPPDLDHLPPLERRVARASNYVARMDPAVSGKGGHDATFKVAIALVRGFCLPSEESLRLLSRYNERCEPPWSEKELRHKLSDAVANSRVPWAYLLSIREASQPKPPPAHDPDTGEVLPTETNWRGDLLWRTTRTGAVLRECLQNTAVILGNDPAWEGVLAFNAFRQCVVTLKPPPWHKSDAPSTKIASPDWRDEDDALAAMWLSRRYDMTIKNTMVHDAVVMIARSRAFHPVQDYLEKLEWDRTPRLSTWLIRYLGAADTDYHRLVGRWWLISAVARILRPGCKVDTMMVLEGPQGARKSSALRALVPVPSWFFDSDIRISHVDAYQVIRGRWIVEFAELDALKRAEIAAVKSYMTSSTDAYRPSYGRTVVEVPRQNVFAGTTNESIYLHDPTGNRRFWPVKCGTIDLDAIAADRDQLWAEATKCFLAGEHWWPEQEEHAALCTDAQSDRADNDEWQNVIWAWLERQVRSSFPLSDVLIEALGFRANDGTIKAWSDHDQKRASRCLQALGWIRTRRGNADASGYRPWLYERRPS